MFKGREVTDPIYLSDEWLRQNIKRIEADIRRWSTGEAHEHGQMALWQRNLAYLERTYPHLFSDLPKPPLRIEQIRARVLRRRFRAGKRLSLSEIRKRISR